MDTHNLFVECIRLDGTIIQIPQNELTIRPAAYALIRHEEKLLLLRVKATGKYHLPGGSIELGERMAEALQRETLEETGIEIIIGELAFFRELFFYYDTSKKAYHGLHFFFHATPTSFDLLADDDVIDGSAEKPRWIPIDELEPDRFQIFGAEIIANCRQP